MSVVVVDLSEDGCELVAVPAGDCDMSGPKGAGDEGVVCKVVTSADEILLYRVAVAVRSPRERRRVARSRSPICRCHRCSPLHRGMWGGQYASMLVLARDEPIPSGDCVSGVRYFLGTPRRVFDALAVVY